MSRRSYASYSHEKRISKYRVTDEDLFKYVIVVICSEGVSNTTHSQLCAASIVRATAGRLMSLERNNIGIIVSLAIS